MPSPLGHALGGMAVGLLASGKSCADLERAHWLERPSRCAGFFALLAVLPDLDLLVGAHSAETHSLGAVLIVTLPLLIWSRDPRFASAGGAAYASHVLLDWLGRDTSPPLGIMALWPISTEYYMSPVPLLEAVSRRYSAPGFWTHTLKVGIQEILIFGSLALFAWWRHTARADSQTLRARNRRRDATKRKP